MTTLENPDERPVGERVAEALGVRPEDDSTKRDIEKLLRLVSQKQTSEDGTQPFVLEIDHKVPEGPPIRLRLIPGFKLGKPKTDENYRIVLNTGDSVTTDAEVEEVQKIGEKLQAILEVSCTSSVRKI